MADIADNLTPEEIEEDKKFESEMYGKCGWDRMCQMKMKAEREQAREASASSETTFRTRWRCGRGSPASARTMRWRCT